MDVYWEVGGTRVSTVSMGDYVTAHVVLRASSAGVSDHFTVNIRKDIAYSSDVKFLTKSFSFSIPGGESEDFIVPFYPDAVSGFSFRWYFVEILFSDGSSWLMDQLSPPRLKIV